MDLFGIHAWRGRWSVHHLRILLPGGLIGIALGGLAFGMLSVNMIRLVVGLLAVLFSINKWFAVTDRLSHYLSMGERTPGPRRCNLRAAFRIYQYAGLTRRTALCGLYLLAETR